MKQWQRNWLVVGGLLVGAGMSACGGDPSCEDLANCVDPPGSSGSSGNASGSGSSSGGMGGPENCTNGLDDDNDGSIDCADAECADKYTCIPPVPAGFTDIVMISVKPYGETAAACAGGVMPTLFYQNPATEACDACTCDVSGVQCLPGQVATGFSFDMMCGNVMPAQVMPGQCQQVFGNSAILQSAPMASGACTASASGGPLKPPMETTIATCPVGSADGRGCGMSGTCVPSDGIATAEHLCIKRVGHEVCPGDWPLALYAFESFTDDRTGCTNCSCTTTCEGGKYTLHPNDPTCAAAGIPVEPAGTCVQNGGGGFNMNIMLSPLVASCTTTGGQAMGSVTPMTETTFCCF